MSNKNVSYKMHKYCHTIFVYLIWTFNTTILFFFILFFFPCNMRISPLCAESHTKERNWTWTFLKKNKYLLSKMPVKCISNIYYDFALYYSLLFGCTYKIYVIFTNKSFFFLFSNINILYIYTNAFIMHFS